jgi:hypothetical protein
MLGEMEVNRKGRNQATDGTEAAFIPVLPTYY